MDGRDGEALSPDSLDAEDVVDSASELASSSSPSSSIVPGIVAHHLLEIWWSFEVFPVG